MKSFKTFLTENKNLVSEFESKSFDLGKLKKTTSGSSTKFHVIEYDITVTIDQNSVEAYDNEGKTQVFKGRASDSKVIDKLIDKIENNWMDNMPS